MMAMSYDFMSASSNAATVLTWGRGGYEELSDSQWNTNRFLYQPEYTVTIPVLVPSSGMGGHSRNKFTHDAVVETFRARTPLGERLLALRRAFVQKGGGLVDADSLDSEMSRRRGGVMDA